MCDVVAIENWENFKIAIFLKPFRTELAWREIHTWEGITYLPVIRWEPQGWHRVRARESSGRGSTWRGLEGQTGFWWTQKVEIWEKKCAWDGMSVISTWWTDWKSRLLKIKNICLSIHWEESSFIEMPRKEKSQLLWLGRFQIKKKHIQFLSSY